MCAVYLGRIEQFQVSNMTDWRGKLNVCTSEVGMWTKARVRTLDNVVLGRYRTTNTRGGDRAVGLH